MGIDIFAVAYIAGLYEFLADGAYVFLCISAQQPCGGVCFACIGVDAAYKYTCSHSEKDACV